MVLQQFCVRAIKVLTPPPITVGSVYFTNFFAVHKTEWGHYISVGVDERFTILTVKSLNVKLIL